MYSGGRPVHQGYFPFTGTLKTGSKQFFELSVIEAEAKSLELYLLTRPKVFGLDQAAYFVFSC